MTSKYKVLRLTELMKEVPFLSPAETKFKATRKSLELVLNKLASDGYELVQIYPGGSEAYVILKKSE
jgi:hypothetical protein